MKFNKKIIIEISGDSRLPEHLLMHFMLYLENVMPIFELDHEDEKVKIDIKKKE